MNINKTKLYIQMSLSIEGCLGATFFIPYPGFRSGRLPRYEVFLLNAAGVY